MSWDKVPRTNSTAYGSTGCAWAARRRSCAWRPIDRPSCVWRQSMSISSAVPWNRLMVPRAATTY